MLKVEWWYKINPGAINEKIVSRSGYVIAQQYVVTMEKEGWNLLVQSEMSFFELWAVDVTVLGGMQ